MPPLAKIIGDEMNKYDESESDEYNDNSIKKSELIPK